MSDFHKGMAAFSTTLLQTDLKSINSILAADVSSWNVLTANSISTGGLIAGQGEFGGLDHAVLLTTVPEPSTFAYSALQRLAWRLVARRRARNGKPMQKRFVVLVLAILSGLSATSQCGFDHLHHDSPRSYFVVEYRHLYPYGRNITDGTIGGLGAGDITSWTWSLSNATTVYSEHSGVPANDVQSPPLILNNLVATPTELELPALPNSNGFPRCRRSG